MEINKNHFITLGVSFLVMLAIFVVVFMLMLPKQSSVTKANVSNYEKISKSQYTFESTKNITSEPLKKQYSVTSDDMREYKSNNQYTTGNTDPFAPEDNASQNNSNTTKPVTTTQTKNEAIKKTTNSNGGVANPPSTDK